MPRRNLYLIIAVGLLSAVCYFRVHRDRYGQTLGEVIELIEQKSLDPAPREKLFEGAMEGMLEQLDEHSAYISPATLPGFQQLIDQEFTGVGMEVAIEPKTKRLLVVSPLIGSPAYEAGIRAGDQIVSINGRPTAEMTLKESIEQMRGKVGETVVLAVLHEGQREPVDLTIVRAVIHTDTVRGDTRNADGSWNFFLAGHDRIGYLRITSFGKDTSHNVAVALGALTEQRLGGLIIDLRDDPGGLLEEAWKVCDLFINNDKYKGVIVTVRGPDKKIKKVYEATAKSSLPRFPVAVIINQDSASASEIVAACLQDHERAVIVGQRSYGKGTVQEMIELGKSPAGDELGAIKLTTASYWRPSGRNIHHPHDAKNTKGGSVGREGRDSKEGKAGEENDDWGVTPDKGYQVVLEEAEQTQWELWRSKRDALRPGTVAPDDKPTGKPADAKPADSATKQPPPAKNGGTEKAGQKSQEKPFVDRPLARAVQYIELEAAGASAAGGRK